MAPFRGGDPGEGLLHFGIQMWTGTTKIPMLLPGLCPGGESFVSASDRYLPL